MHTPLTPAKAGSLALLLAGIVLAAWPGVTARTSGTAGAPRTPDMDRMTARGERTTTEALSEFSAARSQRPRPAGSLQTIRNPFQLAERVAPVPPEPPPAIPALPAADPDVVTVVLPELIGIAEFRTERQPERMAIFADGSEPLIARVGDVIHGRFSIQAIRADAVDCSDQNSGRLYVVVLR